MKNMKIMIIGNGFDLNLGLKTGYNDFIGSEHFHSLNFESNLLAQYLRLQSNLNNWIDIERHLTIFSKASNLQNLTVKKDFLELEMALMNYLRDVQNDEINEKSKAFEMFKNEIETTNFIFNFNYTNSIFRIAKILGIDESIIEDKHSYVHGSIGNSSIIFGVEDKAEIHASHIFLKKSYNINFGKSNIGQHLSYRNNLVLFGHSLGITDSSYFENYIRTLCGNYSNPVELKFYYYGEIGYDEMMKAIDLYSANNLSSFKNNNKFIPIDSSETFS